MGQRYIALIGDIVGSRKLKERDRVQEALENALNKVNTKYTEQIAAKFLITLGDEFQGLMKVDAPVYEVISQIVESIHPVELRFGLGFGEITTPVSEVALGMDGPAFYLARDAIKQAHEYKGHTVIFKSRNSDSCEENMINAVFELLAVNRKLQNSRFLEMLPLLRSGMKQSKISQELQVTQPYVSKVCSSAYWTELQVIEQQINKAITNCLKKIEGNK